MSLTQSDMEVDAKVTKLSKFCFDQEHYRQSLSQFIGKDGTSLLSSLSSQCGPVPYGTLSVLLLHLRRRLDLAFGGSGEINSGVWMDGLHPHSFHPLGHS